MMRPFEPDARGQFHCFVGTPEQAAELGGRGHLVSFTGIATFKNAKDVQKTAAETPAEQLMVETDCPYLAPEPNRGKRCEPAFTREILLKIAGLKGLSPEELATATEATANQFFRFTD
jgi:TatD DNase family protein